jgi:hypothetical protein
MAAKFTKRRKIAAAISVVLVLAAIAIKMLVVNRSERDKFFVSSCANHMIQLKMDLLFFAEAATNFPVEIDTRRAFSAMGSTSSHSAEWLATYSSACPESFSKDGSIGYVFVGDGLPTNIAKESDALLLFCPADSHQRSEQHCHAVHGHGSMSCLKSNAEMMDLLKRELQRAQDGIIPYSTNAVARMRQELNARQQHEDRRRATKGQGV